MHTCFKNNACNDEYWQNTYFNNLFGIIFTKKTGFILKVCQAIDNYSYKCNGYLDPLMERNTKCLITYKITTYILFLNAHILFTFNIKKLLLCPCPSNSFNKSVVSYQDHLRFYLLLLLFLILMLLDFFFSS